MSDIRQVRRIKAAAERGEVSLTDMKYLLALFEEKDPEDFLLQINKLKEELYAAQGEISNLKDNVELAIDALNGEHFCSS